MTVHDLETWLAAYGQAWESRDPQAAAALFSEDASYHETPFAEPAEGQDGVREYWAEATGNHRDVRFSFEIVSFSASRGIARWWAEYTRATSGVRARLDGIFLLDFDDNGLCRTLREWWHKSDVQ